MRLYFIGGASGSGKTAVMPSLSHLDTFDWQAKDFYLKHGYEIFGVLENCPAGKKRYFMKKTL